MAEPLTDFGNMLLDGLSLPLRQRLAPDLRRTNMAQGQTLVSSRQPSYDIYFPISCVCSVVSTVSDGQSVESAVIGREGGVAFPLFSTTSRNHSPTVMIQLAGMSYVMSRGAFMRHMSQPEFLLAVMDFTEELFSFVCQSSACYSYHSAEQRLAKWLLIMQDRVRENELRLTQEFLANMIGVQRPTVSIVARILQAASLIQFHYGRINILDREGLEEAACECYEPLSGLRQL